MTHDGVCILILSLKHGAPYPQDLQYVQTVRRNLIPQLSWPTIKKNLEYFSTRFPTRFCKSKSGAKAAQWLLTQVQDVVARANHASQTTTTTTAAAAAVVVSVAPFKHSKFGQKSIVARIQGRSNTTVIVGAHLDSINVKKRKTGRAPGVDDNGSGTFLLLECLRVLLTDAHHHGYGLEKTIEFHWYAAEEVGLRGSRDVFRRYRREGRRVWGVLQQDMVGYTRGTLDAGKEESFGLMTDFTHAGLNAFVAQVIHEYTDISYVNSTCGYACSDHVSATRNGFPASFVLESAPEYQNPYIHTPRDTMEHIDPAHVLQHGRLVLGFLYELGFSK
ncbi:uncharacterized protein SETTUDRAFT_110755 [Exserohilum turcica Et28A]|uniref:Peptide hydrolase n=1 Tax=Exserohilum turcicum (strain 28A) TaxID=671987 RepID=R0K9H5_EXST2|nr:uncharacterized protein SETTUDRAFT_110755 [Exserohilum turcica Et28A]EOA86074.1 hypothetical protein SETTUDRAFT_110755 [Exserohilum turcica Et28A]